MTIFQRAARLRIVGVILLLAGLGAGGFLYWRSFQGDVNSDDDTMLRAQEESRAYELAMQKNVGPVGLLMSRWSDRLGAPRGVAVEVALVAGLAAGGCFVLAARPPRG